MNKNLLICAVLASGLLLTACVKKETPQEDQQSENVPASEVVQEEQPTEFQPLEPASEAMIEEVPETVEVVREETANTTTEIRRETRPVEPVVEAQPAPTVEQTTQPAPKINSGSAQSEDDAVAAAIAAAMPAIEN